MFPETFPHTYQTERCQNTEYRNWNFHHHKNCKFYKKLESDLYVSVLGYIAGNRIFLTLEMH